MFVPIDPELVHPAIRGDDIVEFGFYHQTTSGNGVVFSELTGSFYSIKMFDGSMILLNRLDDDGILRLQASGLTGRGFPIDGNNQYPSTQNKLCRLIESSYRHPSAASWPPFGSITWKEALNFADHPLVKTRFYIRMVCGKVVDQFPIR